MADGFSALPPLNALRVFEVVARHLNFRLAADELGVTQAAVAQQIRGLEANLGLKLFDRLPRGLGLTGAGQRYSADIRSAFALIASATQALRPDGAQLTVSVTPTFAAKWLIPRLSSFTAQHPHIDLQVLATDRLSQLRPEGVDLAVRYGRPPFGPALQTELLLPQRIVAVGSPALLQAQGAPTDLAQLQRYTLLHDAHNFWPDFIAEALRQPLQAAARNVRFNQTALAIDAAIAGQGLALASYYFVQSELAAGRLALAFDHELHLDQAFYLVWPRNAHQPPALATVRSWLLQQAVEFLSTN
ncbi:LysR substrate-binding domain-containing protein [Pseudomonas faucium]|uniref:LysR substrate-binding domain-containing protein n=1 Tax=Pseudomonas faucium TaxID=2740518 RepID=UPI00159655A2|nr:LysR substrate-binding domain-containing protein [Pseudomonas faucium]